MKYWLLRGKKPQGPYEPAQLIREADFAAETMVCPEDLPPAKTKNWKAANKVKDLKPWLRELAAKESATGLPWEADRTRMMGRTPPPAAAPGLEPILPASLPSKSAADAAERFQRRDESRGPELPQFRTTKRGPSSLSAGVATFSVIVCLGTLAMMLSGRCSGEPPARKGKVQRRYVVPASP